MVKISTSILSYNNPDLIFRLNETNTDYLHIDIMDGKFVKNKAFSMEEVKEVNRYSVKPLDVHLMVEEVEKYLLDLFLMKVEFITFHYEILKNLNLLKKIKEKGIKCGLSVKPNTDIKEIFPLLKEIDLVLIMSVEPGSSGQKFIKSTLTKIKLLKEEIEKQSLDVLISVDGGINHENARLCVLNGADILVSSTYIIKNNNLQERISNLRGIFNKT
ncbi:MAG: ribulose-phosphate 3-epimerase [Bacilli bacterium]|jgi:ribulose-phosphate 3-epimerase